MAIRTQYLKIADVFAPILYAARPRPYATNRSDLCVWVNVVEVEQSNVINSTRRASPSKGGDDLAFLAPISLLPPAVGGNALALAATITVETWGFALKTFACAPSGSGVAALRAIPSAVKASPRRLDVELLRAGDTIAVMAGWLPIRRKSSKALIPWDFHAAIIASCDTIASYFDIACRRVEEAYRQPDLFIERPAAPVQDTLDLSEGTPA